MGGGRVKIVEWRMGTVAPRAPEMTTHRRADAPLRLGA
jgi:hypothetical protein